MSETKAAKPKSKYQGKKSTFYIVNPGGAVHNVDKANASACLAKLGYRLATDAEIETFLKQPVQRADKPIAEPWKSQTLLTEQEDE